MDALDIFTGIMAVAALVASLLYPLGRGGNDDRNDDCQDSDQH